MTIKDMEKQVGITKANIRFYEKEGLLSPVRGSNNYREYTDKDRETLEKIKYLRLTGISVSDIRMFIEGKKNLSILMETRERQIEQETEELNRWKRLCGELKMQNCNFEELDPSLFSQPKGQQEENSPLSAQIGFIERRYQEVIKRDQLSALAAAQKWTYFFCMGCVLSMVFFPVNTILKLPVSDRVMELWTALVLFSPFPYWILRAVNAGQGMEDKERKQWGEREVKRAENRRNHYERQIVEWNQICLASLIIIPFNKMFGIRWPLWLTAVWMVIVFGSAIAVAVVKNRQQPRH